jgi:hypothetical protein
MHHNVPLPKLAWVYYKPIAGTGILDSDAIGYHVYRLVEGDEGDESLWTLVGNPTATAIVDNSWPTLDDGGIPLGSKSQVSAR